MKYLKRFNETLFDQWSDILENIKDICLDLSDNGFSVSYRIINNCLNPNVSDGNHLNLIITIGKVNRYKTSSPKSTKEFKYNDIKEVVERLRYYLSHLSGYKSSANLDANPKIKSILDDRLYHVMNVNIDIEKYRIYNMSMRKVVEQSNPFLKISELNNNLEDICLELEDIGFSVYIQTDNYVSITKGFNGRFKYKEVEEVVNRLKEYLGDRYTEEHILIYSRSGYGNWIDVTEDEIKRLELEDAEANRHSNTGKLMERGIGGVKINFNI